MKQLRISFYGSENMRYKFPKIRGIHKPEVRKEIVNKLNDGLVYVLEKMDGANFSVLGDGDYTELRKRNFPLSREDKNDEKFFEFIDRSNILWSKLPDGYVYYGEIGIEHTIHYNKQWDFLFYAVFDINKERWLKVDEAIELIKNVGLKFVPIINVFPVDTIKHTVETDNLESLIPKRSAYDGLCEGVVLWYEDPNEFWAVKVKSKEFMDLFAQKWETFKKPQKQRQKKAPKDERTKVLEKVETLGLERIIDMYWKYKDSNLDPRTNIEAFAEFVIDLVEDYAVEELGVEKGTEEFEKKTKKLRKTYSGALYKFVHSYLDEFIKELNK